MTAMSTLPFPLLGSSVHISLTPSSTMLQCLSKAFTRPSSFLLFLKIRMFRQMIKKFDLKRIYLNFYLQLMRT